jgi:iron complex outermembrane receptor protein
MPSLVMRRPRSLLTVLALVPFAAMPAWAQQPDDAEDRSDDTILVIGTPDSQSLTAPSDTGSRLNLSPLETPASLNVLDGETIRARGDLSIADAQSRMPGITSTGNPGNGNTALAARGFDGQGSVLQLIDGVRLFPVAGTITFPTDPWMVDQIDVLSGPASVLYGQGALGGAVNVIMRKPSETIQAQAEIGYGSFQTFHAAAGVGGPIGDQLAYRIDGSYRRSDGPVERGDSHSLALSGTLRWTPAESLSVTLRNDYGDNNPMKYFGTPLINSVLDDRNKRLNYNVADAQMWFEDNRTSLQIDWNPSETVTVSQQVYRLRSKRFWQNLESYCWTGATGYCRNGYNGAPPDPPGPPNMIFRTDNFGILHDQTQWGAVGTIALKTALSGSTSNDLVVGYDYNFIKLTYSHDFNGDIQEDFLNPFTFAPGRYTNSVGITPQYRTRTHEWAIFAEDRLELTDQISLVGGIRHERNKVRRTTIGGAVVVNGKKLNNTTWRIGVVFQPSPAVSLYAQYATGVDPLGTLTTYSGGQVAYSHATGKQIEIGAKASFLNGRGSATIAAYRIEKNGLLSQRTLSSPIEQVGQRSSQGIEATIALDLAGGFGIEANGTILNANFDDFRSGATIYTDNTPPNVPESAANLWLRWDATDKLQARAGLRYVGKRWADNANDYEVPAYATIDATISYAVTPNLAVDLRGYNLLDKDYAVTTYGDEQWMLGRPQSFDVSLRAAF